MKHITAVDVIFYVLEGRATVVIGEEKKEIGANTLIESPVRVPHRLINDGTVRARVLVVKRHDQRIPRSR